MAEKWERPGVGQDSLPHHCYPVGGREGDVHTKDLKEKEGFTGYGGGGEKTGITAGSFSSFIFLGPFK